MTKSTSSNEQVKKRRSLFCKIAGGALLLLSFVVQNYSYDLWNTRKADYMNATRDYAAMQRSSLLYQNLYFSLQASDSIRAEAIRPSVIQNAAKSDVISRMILHEANDRQDEHARILIEIQKEVTSVKDYPSYLAYLDKARSIDEFSLQQEMEQVKNDEDQKILYRNVFLATYMLGSVLLLLGFRYE